MKANKEKKIQRFPETLYVETPDDVRAWQGFSREDYVENPPAEDIKIAMYKFVGLVKVKTHTSIAIDLIPVKDKKVKR